MADTFLRTDLGNAERLAAWHGQDLRHVPAWGWMVWDGRHWARSDKLARERAHQTVRRIYREAGEHPDEQQRQELARHAAASEASGRITAMLREAEARPEIRAEVADFDRDPLLLNVANGTIDLRTGQLRPHRREDLITRIIAIDYDEDSFSEEWEAFLTRCCEGKPGMQNFLRRAAGYTLTGRVEEDAVFALHGPAGSGKTTFEETMQALLGPYAGTIPVKVLYASANPSGGHSEDIARLVGLRLVSAIEASPDEHLREGLFKHLTGGDTITASLKHRPAFDFRPVFKLWLRTNDMPYIRSDDGGSWRRLHKLPFDNSGPRPGVRERLQTPANLRGVLAWAVRGCLEWRSGGLEPPACVTGATSELRRWMSGGFEDFLAERADLSNPRSWTPAHDIRSAYQEWADQHGVPAARRVNDRRLAALLRQAGCEDDRLWDGVRAVRAWWAVRLRSDEEIRAVATDATDRLSQFSPHARDEENCNNLSPASSTSRDEFDPDHGERSDARSTPARRRPPRRRRRSTDEQRDGVGHWSAGRWVPGE